MVRPVCVVKANRWQAVMRVGLRRETEASTCRSPDAARPRRVFISQGMRRDQLLREFVPDLCQSIADLGVLADLVRRKNNNLRRLNVGRGTDSVSGHHVFKYLRALNFGSWFQLVPILARRRCLK